MNRKKALRLRDLSLLSIAKPRKVILMELEQPLSFFHCHEIRLHLSDSSQQFSSVRVPYLQDKIAVFFWIQIIHTKRHIKHAAENGK